MARLASKVTRREALLSSGMFGGSCFFGHEFTYAAAKKSPSKYQPLLATQTFIWFQYFQSQKRTLADGVKEMCEQIRRAGFSHLELLADFLTPELRSRTLTLVQENSLHVLSIYADSTMHSVREAEKSIADIAALANSVRHTGDRAIVTDPLPKPNNEPKSTEELALQARSLNSLGSQLRNLGMELLIHHHTPELAHNAREWRYELQYTDPKLVRCCVDVEWAFRGGQEAVSFIEGCVDRLDSLHLRSSKQGVWMEDLGDGDVDYRKVADYLKQINYTGYLIVELAYEKNTKVTRPLVEDLRLSRLYAKRVFGI
jgi:sugar phosphate isomerase/epimerase